MEPWLDKRRDEKGKIMTSPAGVTLYEGFCMDFLEKLSEYANFDYQIVVQGDSRIPGMISFGTCWVFAQNLEYQLVFFLQKNQFLINENTRLVACLSLLFWEIIKLSMVSTWLANGEVAGSNPGKRENLYFSD